MGKQLQLARQNRKHRVILTDDVFKLANVPSQSNNVGIIYNPAMNQISFSNPSPGSRDPGLICVLHYYHARSSSPEKDSKGLIVKDINSNIIQ